MRNKVNLGLKVTFAIHAVFSGLVGLGYLLMPEAIGAWVGWDTSDAAYRLIGAFVLALGVSSALAAAAQTWLEVRIKVGLELVWTALATVVMVWAVVTGQVPASAWLYVGIFTIFFGVFAYYAYVERQEEVAILQLG